ncbi:MAG: DUF6588 family protein [Bacteroidales bacterium]
MKNVGKLLILLCFSLITINLHSQDFEDFIRKYTDDNGKLYMQPLADAFGANLNSGLYHNARIEINGFQFYLGLTAMMAYVPESNKTFEGTTQGFFSPEQTTVAPTIFGSSEVVEVAGDDGTVYTFPGGLNIDQLPLAAPTLSIGSLYGTNATFRFLAADIGEDFGKINLFGWGLRHNINQYFNILPINMAAGFYMQSFSVGDFVDAKSWLFNIQGSYNWSLLTFYGGIGIENSGLDVSYVYEEDDTEIDFDMEGANKIRGTLGLTVNLGPVKLHTDYTLASQSLLTMGLGVGINDR